MQSFDSSKKKHVSIEDKSGFLSDLKSREESVIMKSNKSESEDNNVRFSYDLYG